MHLIATPLSFTTPGQLLAQIAAHSRDLRLLANLTQEGLASRAGVPYASLRVFERTGRISLFSFLKLMQALGRDTTLLNALAPSHTPYASIDDVVKTKPHRKRGSLT